MNCGHVNIGFKVLAASDNCQVYRKGDIYLLNELIPKGHCYELLHSLLPYMVTFEHNGWFKWERNKDTIVVCCPSTDNNVCVELKKVPTKDEINFQYKIINLRGRCRFYKQGTIFEIKKSTFDRLCWDLFNVIYPYLRTEFNGKRVTCGMSNKSIFELKGTGEL